MLKIKNAFKIGESYQKKTPSVFQGLKNKSKTTIYLVFLLVLVGIEKRVRIANHTNAPLVLRTKVFLNAHD